MSSALGISQILTGHEGSWFAQGHQATPSGTQSPLAPFHQVLLGFLVHTILRNNSKEWVSPMYQTACISGPGHVCSAVDNDDKAQTLPSWLLCTRTQWQG